MNGWRGAVFGTALLLVAFAGYAGVQRVAAGRYQIAGGHSAVVRLDTITGEMRSYMMMAGDERGDSLVLKQVAVSSQK